MSAFAIPHLRLSNQRLAQSSFTQPAQVVSWLGAVQAQDYAAAKWALALRAPGLTDAAVDRALADGSILRTHVLRPTWHFVVPADIRWLLELTAPRVHTFNASYYRKMGLDQATFERCNAALAQALQGGRQLTRPELDQVLQQAGLPTDELRFTLMIMHAELDSLLCSGPRRGKQFTYALLDERVPASQPLSRNEALSALALRYFSSHGPATLADFTWWSGLAAADARSALEMVKPQLQGETLAERTFWFSGTATETPGAHNIQLLPCYDEYTVAYADRSDIFDAHLSSRLGARGDVLSAYTLLLDGYAVGSWRRAIKAREVVIEIDSFSQLDEATKQALALAAEQYGTFLQLPVALKWR